MIRATLINKRFFRHWKKTEHKSTQWSTKAGSFKTTRKCNIEFTLPAFHENRKISSCKACVDESHQESSNYDLIIGRDLMLALGINILFDTAEIAWDNDKVKMQPPEPMFSIAKPDCSLRSLADLREVIKELRFT